MTAAAVADQILRLANGRKLDFKVYGDQAGAPLLFLHGTPGSRDKSAIGDDAGRELGLAIVAPDRWGYGLSDAPAAPSLPEFADDMAALMDRLGCRRFAVGGISGGGAYATAVAACFAPRVTALALASMGPVAGAGSREALSPFHRFCFGAQPRSPRAIAAVFALFSASLERSPRLAAHLATLRAGPRDKVRLARPEIARWLLGSFREGLRRGTGGPVIDLMLFSRHWDVDPGIVQAPARLWIGTADTAVPVSAARLLARSIPGCTLTELPAEGHFWVAENYREVLAWVATTVHRARGAAEKATADMQRRHLSGGACCDPNV
jgi:pimeloyl-ACP methyl ester carboxylesterase